MVAKFVSSVWQKIKSGYHFVDSLWSSMWRSTEQLIGPMATWIAKRAAVILPSAAVGGAAYGYLFIPNSGSASGGVAEKVAGWIVGASLGLEYGLIFLIFWLFAEAVLEFRSAQITLA